MQQASNEKNKTMIKKNVLFICTGNSCRSPMAAGIMKHLLGDNPEYHISSAGTAGIHGMEASDHAKFVMKAMGIDISSHRSMGISLDIIKEAGIVFCMTEQHSLNVLSLCPDAENKTHLLLNYANGVETKPMEVTDPIGASEQIYRDCAHVLYDAIDDVLKKWGHSQ